jgi:hypothetical protein
MGIGRQQGRAALQAIRAATNRANARDEVAQAVAILNEWLSKRDMQDAAALQGFADSRTTQFDNFVQALPEPTVDQTP